MKHSFAALNTVKPALAKIPCPELRQLPKSPRPRGVIFKNQNAGNPTQLIAPHVSEPMLDPGHPAARSPRRAMISWNAPSEVFRLVAAPKALLFRRNTENEPYFGLMFESWEDRLKRLAAEASRELSRAEISSNLHPSSRNGKEKVWDGDAPFEGVGVCPDAVERYVARRIEVLSKAVPMSIMFATNKAKMGGKPFYMSKVKKRVKGAIALIINQGATVAEETVEADDGSLEIQKKVVCDLEEVERMKEKPGGGWIMKDWTYMIIPTMKLYRIPYSELIPEMREALLVVRQKASKMELDWQRPHSNALAYCKIT